MKTHEDYLHTQRVTYKLMLDYLICEIRTVLRLLPTESAPFYIITDTLKNIDEMKKEIK